MPAMGIRSFFPLPKSITDCLLGPGTDFTRLSFMTKAGKIFLRRPNVLSARLLPLFKIELVMKLSPLPWPEVEKEEGMKPTVDDPAPKQHRRGQVLPNSDTQTIRPVSLRSVLICHFSFLTCTIGGIR